MKIWIIQLWNFTIFGWFISCMLNENLRTYGRQLSLTKFLFNYSPQLRSLGGGRWMVRSYFKCYLPISELYVRHIWRGAGILENLFIAWLLQYSCWHEVTPNKWLYLQLVKGQQKPFRSHNALYVSTYWYLYSKCCTGAADVV